MPTPPLAQLRLKSGDTKEAVELANRAVLLAPDNPMILDTHGWILYQSKDLQKALQSLEKAVASPKAGPTHHYHLAVVYEQLGMNAKALEQVDAALATKADFSGKQEALDLAKKLRQNP